MVQPVAGAQLAHALCCRRTLSGRLMAKEARAFLPPLSGRFVRGAAPGFVMQIRRKQPSRSSGCV